MPFPGRRSTHGKSETHARQPEKMVETFGMEILHRGSDFDSAVITISDVNRPALQLVGFYDYFDDKRLQILGRGEMRYLDRMTEAERLRVFNKLMSYPFPALIVARNMDVPGELLQMAESTTARCCAPPIPRWMSPAGLSTI